MCFIARILFVIYAAMRYWFRRLFRFRKYKVIGYWDAGRRNGPDEDCVWDIDLIDPFYYSHIVYHYAGIDDEGGITSLDRCRDIEDFGFWRVTNLKMINPDLKVVIGLGGPDQSANLSRMANDTNMREHFLDTVVDFLRDHKFDGLELMWMYPNQGEGSNYNDRMKYSELVTLLYSKLKLTPENYSFSASVSPMRYAIQVSYHVKHMMRYLDWITILAFDFYTHKGGYTGHSAPLYPSPIYTTERRVHKTVEASVNNWFEAGVDPSKMILAIPMFSRTYTTRPRRIEPHSPISGPGVEGQKSRTPGYLNHCETRDLLKSGSWKRIWDRDSKVPFLFQGNQWVSYEDEESIHHKLEFMKARKMGGVGIWKMSTDDYIPDEGADSPLTKFICNDLGIVVD